MNQQNRETSKPSIKQIGWAFKKNDTTIFGGWVFLDGSLPLGNGYSFEELEEFFVRRSEWDLPFSGSPSLEGLNEIWEEVEEAQRLEEQE